MARRRLRPFRRDDWATLTILGTLLGVMLIVLVVTLSVLLTPAEDALILPTATAASAETTQDAASSAISGERLTLDDGRTIALRPWAASGRFTMLVVGQDDAPAESTFETAIDLIALVSIDPTAQRVGLLVIPSSLYLDVATNQPLQSLRDLIRTRNAAQSGLGVSAAADAITRNFGMRVDQTLTLTYTALTQIVDAYGPLIIDIPAPIANATGSTSTPEFAFSSGEQPLTGDRASLYLRLPAENDAARLRRQQQILTALYAAALSSDRAVSHVIAAPSLWRSLRADLLTGLTLDQSLQFVWYLKDLPPENLRSAIMDDATVSGYLGAPEPNAVMPRRAALADVLTTVFGASYNQ
jgi:anionic cell wall polymer biosynthesis LytR-Cps2A-Psr (LCP) family protein